MKITSSEEIRMFENAIDHCHKAVFLVTPDGKQYDLKTPAGRLQGLTSMLDAPDYAEPELFTTCYEDEMVMFDFIAESRQAA